jgi:hypothetical protein
VYKFPKSNAMMEFQLQTMLLGRPWSRANCGNIPVERDYFKYSKTPLLCPRNFSCHLQNFFRSLQFPYIHNVLFTLILHFQNVRLPAIYIFRALTEGTFWHKAVSADKLLVSTCLLCTTIAICWSAIQLRRICILLYIRPRHLLYDNHSK